MRALLILSIAACSADIPSGSYECGPEQACPPGQACNGVDNTCVAPTLVEPFKCLAAEEKEPDNSPTTATSITNLGCVSNVFTFDGCLAAGDMQDWFTFTAPTGCAGLEADIKVSFPLAFETVGLVLGDAAGAMVAPDAACTAGTKSPADDERCIKQSITQGQSYTVEVKPAGNGNCNGACNYNRYTIQVQLTTPG
jgi:hypothetical protein